MTGPDYTRLTAPGFCHNVDVTGPVRHSEAIVTTTAGQALEEALILGETLTHKNISVGSCDPVFFDEVAAHAVACANRLRAARRSAA